MPASAVTPGPRAQLFQRHDLIWLDDGSVWVVARRSLDDVARAQLRLGRCSPPQAAACDAECKPARHSTCASESRVARHRPALRAGEVLAALTHADGVADTGFPAAIGTPWRVLLATLQQLERQFGIALRVYGSLAWQTLTALGDVPTEALGFLRAGSDLDLLVDLGTRRPAEVGPGMALPALLAELAACSQRSVADGGPRLDGEVRLPGYGDVAWREWRADDRAQLLVKNAVDVRLRPVPSDWNLRAQATMPGPAELDAAACLALRREAMAWPKPGLVSPVDQGSHADMDIALLLRAIEALEGWFAEMARAAQAGAHLADLAAIGRCAEVAMLRATGGINAYKGAIFNLGLLVAGAAVCQSGESPAECVRRRWSSELLQHRVDPNSHGARVRARDGAGGAVGEAARGFPTLMQHILPAWRAAPSDRALQAACLAGIAHLDDTNLLWRGGTEGLRWAQTQARDFLSAGVLRQPDWESRLATLHAAFVARRLSPGGSADLAACAAFLVALE